MKYLTLHFHFFSRIMLHRNLKGFTFWEVRITISYSAHVKLRSLNQTLQVWVFQIQDFAFKGFINISYRQIAAKRAHLFLFLSLISLKTVLLYSISICKVKKVKLGISDACVYKNIYIKQKLKISFNKASFCQNH